jgi:hypothetical protein
MKAKLLLFLSLALLSLTPGNLAAASVNYYLDGATSGSSMPVWQNSDGVATFFGKASQQVVNGTSTSFSSEYTITINGQSTPTDLYSFYVGSNVDGGQPVLALQLDTWQIAKSLGGQQALMPSGYFVVGNGSGASYTQVIRSTSPGYLASNNANIGAVPGAPAPPATLLAAFGLAIVARGRKLVGK